MSTPGTTRRGAVATRRSLREWSRGAQRLWGRALGAWRSLSPAERAALLCAAALLLATLDAAARPGGGQTFSGSSSGQSSSGYSSGGTGYSGGGTGYSGGGTGYSGGGTGYSGGAPYPSGGSSSSGRGNNDSELLWLIVSLIVRYPAVGVPAVVVAIVALLLWVRSNHATPPDWFTASSGLLQTAWAPPPLPPPPPRTREQLERIRTLDPDFSPVLFEDFAHVLYAAAHEARGAGRLEHLGPYLRRPARLSLARIGGGDGEVRGVVIGAVRVVEVGGLFLGDEVVHVVLEFEANYTEGAHGAPGEMTYYTVERWRFTRRREARSRPPEKTRVLTCPNCGAGLDHALGGTCSYCKKEVDTGAFDWVVQEINVRTRESRGVQLTGDVEERGTDLPTVADPEAPVRYAEIVARDPALTWPALEARIGLIFRELQQAWSGGRWEQARAFLSDNLYESQRFWLAMYARAGLRNATERARITRLQIARVSSDKYYDAITVRLFATGLDYTLNASGEVVAGSRTKERAYSEYWTLVRARGAKGGARSDLECPNCGAALKVEMAGHCEYCRAKVTTGEFDWVLSRIEQDDSYTG